MTVIYLCAFVLTALLSFALTRLVRNLSTVHGWVGTPSPHHIHPEPVPRFGGIAIYFAFMAGISGTLLAASLFHLGVDVSPQRLTYILVAGTLIFLLGMVDDVVNLKPYVKFGVQALAAIVLYAGGLRVLEIPLLFGSRDLHWLALPLTVLWVLWITNAFNLIDGLDGLAAGSAFFSTVTVFVVSLGTGANMVSLMVVALAGSILGFLKYNFNPATIFLGDCGSLFIGFMLSALALAGSHKTPTIVAVAIPIVSFGLPVFETVLSVIRRFLNGQPIMGADRGHIHHRLLERGMSQRSAVVVLYGVSALCGLLSLLLINPGGPSVGIVLFVLGAGIWLSVQHLGYQEFFELGRVARKAMDQRRVISNNLAVRRAVDMLSRVTDYLQICTLLQETFESNDFDGFQLNLLAESREYSLDEELSVLSSGRSSHRSFIWHKPVLPSAKSPTTLPSWSLTLELTTSDNLALGYLTLYKSDCVNLMGLDIDLLTTHFRTALAASVERLMAVRARTTSAVPKPVPEPKPLHVYGVQ
jgi:UDP-GlcNAc:undecaprenyl-phosphate GlcNAc-1-phosphate transferase